MTSSHATVALDTCKRDDGHPYGPYGSPTTNTSRATVPPELTTLSCDHCPALPLHMGPAHGRLPSLTTHWPAPRGQWSPSSMQSLLPTEPFGGAGSRGPVGSCWSALGPRAREAGPWRQKALLVRNGLARPWRGAGSCLRDWLGCGLHAGKLGKPQRWFPAACGREREEGQSMHFALEFPALRGPGRSEPSS